MNKIVVLTMSLFLGQLVYAQQIKPAFKNLTFLTYQPAEKANGVVIKDEMEVKEDGKVHLRSVYYNGVADTVYQLSAQKTRELNAIFNGKKKLRSYMTTTSLPPGHHFAGPLEYVRYTAANGATDELVIVDPFMSKQFMDAIDRLAILPAKANPSIKRINDPTVASFAWKCQAAAKYIPPIEEPPPAMN